MPCRGYYVKPRCEGCGRMLHRREAVWRGEEGQFFLRLCSRCRQLRVEQVLSDPEVQEAKSRMRVRRCCRHIRLIYDPETHSIRCRKCNAVVYHLPAEQPLRKRVREVLAWVAK